MPLLNPDDFDAFTSAGEPILGLLGKTSDFAFDYFTSAAEPPRALVSLPGTPVSNTAAAWYEALQGLAALAALPYESQQPLAATALLPYEAVVGGIAATAQNPYEA